MKYAIIDLEWSGKPYENIVQIGGIKFDEKNKEISRFYKVVRPSVQLRQDELDFMHLSADEVNSGISITSAARQLIFWLGGCRELIVWSPDAQQMLYKFLCRYEDPMYHKITVLQYEYARQVGGISFAKVCKKFGIKICTPLHISINDCVYLASVYRILYDIPSWVDQKTVITKSSDEKQYRKSYSSCKFIALSGSGIFHRKNCRYICEKDDSRKIVLFNSNHAITLGYKPCKYCKPEIKIAKREKWDYDEIEDFCNALNLECVIYPKWIQVITGISSWLFKSEGDTIVLHHSNKLRRNYSKSNKCKEDYHEQQERFKDPLDAVFYIYCHDKAALKVQG